MPLQYLGKIAARHTEEKIILKKLKKLDVNISGIKNLKKIKNKTFVIASNHVKPFGGGLWKTGISPDSFILKKVIQENFKKKTSIVMNYAMTESMFVFRQIIVRNLFQNFTKGFVIGLDSIAVKPGDKKSFRDDFLKGVETAISKNNAILIHPQGKYYDDFEPWHEIKAGAGYIALKYNLTIIPVYIKGCTHWNKKGQNVDVVFGKPIFPEGTVDKISKKIKEEILKLKSKLNNFN